MSKKNLNETENDSQDSYQIPDSEWDFYSGLPNPLYYESIDNNRSDTLPTRTNSNMVPDQRTVLLRMGKK